MKHILCFFYARKGSRIDLFRARSDIYVVNFDFFVFIGGVIFQKGHSNIKVVVIYELYEKWVGHHASFPPRRSVKSLRVATNPRHQ